MAKESQTVVHQVEKRRTVAFGVVMLLIMLIASAVSGYLFLTLQKDEEDRLASTIGTILSESIARISFSGKYHSRLLLEEMQKKLPELAYISVETLDGRVEAHTEIARNDSLIQQDEMELSRKVLESGRTVFTEKNSNGVAIKEVLLPYHTGLKPDPSGVIRIGIKVGVTRDNQQRNLVIHLCMILILTVSAVWIMELLSRHFSKRLAKSELALRESNELFTLFMKHSPFYVYIKEVTPTESRVLQASENFQQMIGISGAAMAGKAMEELFPADLAAKITADDWAVVTKGEVLKVDEDFNNRNYSSTKFPISKGDKTLLAGYTVDITERKRAEEELRESKNLITSVIENIPLMIFLKDSKDLSFVLLNHAGEELLGYDRKSLLGKNNLDLFPPEQAAHFMAKDREVLDGEIGILDIPEESILTAKKGTRLLHTKKICVKSPDGVVKYLLGISEDITERKQAEAEREKLQAQLTQAQKIEAVGQLAGGVAHDFNNMLGVIIGYSELILMQMSPTQQFHAELEEIQKAALRSADLTRQLLTFARKQTVAPRVLDLNQTIEGMLKMLRRLIGENISLIWMPGSGLWPINMDPSQIDQVLANLCVNARDAIAGVGKLTVETDNATFDKEYCAAHAGSLPGEYVRITVSDTGRGMDKETLAHIFEPFFTTKDVGEGTGLGLATVYGAVKQNNGFINVYSEPGQGTTFTIYIPRHVETTTETQATASAEPVLPGDEIVMLVEDEPALLQMSKTMLEHLGYTVLAAVTPSEAIRLAGEYSGQINLLATDVIMPEMNGHELSVRLMESRPEMKCLFMSGYTANIIANQGVLKKGVPFIQKPFSINELAAKVRETLES